VDEIFLIKINLNQRLRVRVGVSNRENLVI